MTYIRDAASPLPRFQHDTASLSGTAVGAVPALAKRRVDRKGVVGIPMWSAEVASGKDGWMMDDQWEHNSRADVWWAWISAGVRSCGASG